ncbi:MAG: hypothetical protein VYB54_14185, partial [Pseudomonadota bacterium]|nr:hypothetical protein [Pseudomonadota bacterium]
DVIFGLPPLAHAVRGLRDAVDEKDRLLTLATTILFDRGGRWGVFGYEDSNNSVFAGEPDIVARVVACLGGIERVRARFAAWILIGVKELQPAMPQIDNWRTVYRRIGWPWPFDAWTAPVRTG